MTTNKVQIPREMIDYYNDLAKVRSHYLERRLAPEITEEIKKNPSSLILYLY